MFAPQSNKSNNFTIKLPIMGINVFKKWGLSVQRYIVQTSINITFDMKKIV